MRRWHAVVKNVDAVKKAMRWLNRIEFHLDSSEHFRVPEDADLEDRLKQLPVSSMKFQTPYEHPL
ncbi:hypothetical protein F442_12695, partial [Phytophthora nicotianae P10297]